MNIFEFAREKEKAAEKRYLELAEKAGSKGLKAMFIMLADMEKKHFEALGKMEKSQTAKLKEFNPLAEAKSHFLKMQADKAKFHADVSQVALYRKAQHYEKEAEAFYLKNSKEAKDENQKKILLQMSQEEHKHFVILENIIEFVEGPSDYLESETFNSLEHED